MSNNKEILKKRFTERYTKFKAAVSLINDSIAVIETLKSGENNTNAIQGLISNLSKYDVYEENLNQVKQILTELNSNQLSINEALAYLNYVHDVTCFKINNMLLIQDVFDCYF